jgi:hypothetical protein
MLGHCSICLCLPAAVIIPHPTSPPSTETYVKLKTEPLVNKVHKLEKQYIHSLFMLGHNNI